MSTITLIIAEPLHVVRAGLRALLAGEPDLSVVAEAGDADELLGLVARLRPDVLVLEPALPGPSPAQLIAEVTAIHPELKVLVLASPWDVPASIPLLEAGATGCVLKSDRPEELPRGIRAAAAGELAVSGTLARSLFGRHTHQRSPAVDHLTEREREILDLLTSGLSNKEIAQKLYLSVRTVEVHLRNIYSKLGVRSRLGAVAHTLHHSMGRSFGQGQE